MTFIKLISGVKNNFKRSSRFNNNWQQIDISASKGLKGM